MGALHYLLKNELTAESLTEVLLQAKTEYQKKELHRNAYRRERILNFFQGKQLA